MVNPVTDFVNGLLAGGNEGPPPSANDLNFSLSGLSIELPEINLDTSLSVTKLPTVNTVSSISASLDQLAPVNLNASAAVTALPDLNANLSVNKLPEISLGVALKSIPKILIEAGLDNLRVRELAPVNLQFSLKPAQIRLPFGYKFKVGLFGLDFLSFSMEGEVKAVVEEL